MLSVNKTDFPLSDKQALINMAVYFIHELRQKGKSDDEIETVLKNYNFSDMFIEQIMY